MTTTVRPRTPAELAVLLPYQLGYHPGPSVVLTLLHGKRLGMVQRHDLADDPDQCRETARQALAIAAREGATSVIVLGHEVDEGGSAPLSEAMVEVAGDEGIDVHERVVVRGDRWYSPDCHESCCPEEGFPLPRPEDVPAVAAFVHAGVAPLPSREALVGEVLPVQDVPRARSVGLVLATLGWDSGTSTFGGGSARPPRSWLERAEDVLEWWTAVLDPRPGAVPVADLDDEALAWLAVSLRDVVWRDALMGILCPGALPLTESGGPEVDVATAAATRCPWVSGATDRPGPWHEEVLAVRARLVALAGHLPHGATPPVLTLVAHLAWWAGDGTVAGVCLERALQVDPDHRLAELMLRLLSVGVRPWDDSAGAVTGTAA